MSVNNTKIDAIISDLSLLEAELVASCKNGATSLSTYVENFSAALLGVYYGYPFVNLNYEHHNRAGVDLLCQEKKHAIQITSQEIKSEKVKDSLKKTRIDISKLTVFFYRNKKTSTVIDHLKEKKNYPSYLEIISLQDIIADVSQHIQKLDDYEKVCALWIRGKKSFDTDLIQKINQSAKDRIESNKQSKKYIPEIFIPERTLKSKLRYFVFPQLGRDLFWFNSKTIFNGSRYRNFFEKTVLFADGEKIDYSSPILLKEIFSKEKPTKEDFTTLLKELKKLKRVTEAVHQQAKIFDTNGKELTLDKIHAELECGLCFTIDHLLTDYKITQKKFFFVVKDAGQGKTNLLCDLCENVLFPRKIPTFFFNINELTDTLQNSFLSVLTAELNMGKEDSLNYLREFCLSINRDAIIILDGLNESSDIPKLRKELLELFRYINQLGFIKIIATSRNVAYETFFKSFYDESFSALIISDVERNMFQRKDAGFCDRIYEKYRAHFGVSSYISKSVRRILTNDTLLFRLFCEVYENNKTEGVRDIYKYRLFKLYVEKRAKSLVISGRIKREEDFYDLLNKIVSGMVSSSNHMDFSANSFSSDEKNLLDIIVNEDIIIKKNENNKDYLMPGKTKYSFTYDEFRDYLIANALLRLDDLQFGNCYTRFDNNPGQFDGILRYLFLICKENNDSKLKIIHNKSSNYANLYFNNIFSLDDKALTAADVGIIKKALNARDKYFYYYISKRLDIEQYKNISVLTMVEEFLSNNKMSDEEWLSIFWQYDYMLREDKGIIVELLSEKLDDTTESEVKGMLLLLASFNKIVCADEYEYLNYLWRTFQTVFETSINEICCEFTQLQKGAVLLLSEVRE